MVVAAVFMAGCIFNNQSVMAQDYSQGSGNPSIVVDKKVRPITDPTFYDNIDPKTKVFNEGEQIEFQITVSNNSNQVLENVELKDTLPKYLSLLFYPGTFNQTNNVITDEIGELGIGETQTYLVRATVSNVPTTTLASKNVCLINYVWAGNNITADTDQAQYCIAARSVPNTGADDIATKTLAVILVAVTAVGLRKLARGY